MKKDVQRLEDELKQLQRLVLELEERMGGERGKLLAKLIFRSPHMSKAVARTIRLRYHFLLLNFQAMAKVTILWKKNARLR